MKCVNCGDPGCLCRYCLRAILVTAIIGEVIHICLGR